MRLFSIACAAALLAGCSGMPVGTDGDLAQVTMNNTSGEIVAPARDYLSVPLRSFTASSGPEEWTEVSGVTCTVSAGAYQAVAVTPAAIVIPDLGPDAPNLSAVCRTGELAGRDVVEPEFKWPEEEKPDAFTRFNYGRGGWKGYEKSGPLSYPDLAVGMG